MALENLHILIRRFKLIIFLFTSSVLAVDAQNLVPNPNFTEIDSCPSTFGQIYLASPWETGNDQSPDLFDSCALGGFYEIPVKYGCVDIIPKMDDGFVGIVTYGTLPNGSSIREIMTTRLIDKPPLGVDVYCSISVSPRPRCFVNPDVPNHTCYSNSLGLAIVYENASRVVVVEAIDVIDNVGTWRTLKGCYEPLGDEERIEIQNFRPDATTAIDCEVINPMQNVGYTLVDNVVVAPFDILPDTLIVCDIDQIQFEGLEFYDLPLSWSDQTIGGARRFETSGGYELLADADNCMLEESIEVIVVDIDVIDPIEKVIKCLGVDAILEVTIPGEVLWDNQEIGSIRRVTTTGSFEVTVITVCNTLDLIFEVTQSDCNNIVTTANIFSPNNDGVNDVISFYIDPEVPAVGDITIFDRWGNAVFRKSTSEDLTWDGLTTSGSPMSVGVYVWLFNSDDGTITQSGDITLIR